MSWDINKNKNYIGLGNLFRYFFSQKILRINSHVPWPCHWSSIVSHPERITRAHYRPYPGYMPGCYIQAINGIKLGKNVRLGPGIKLISANHDLSDYDKHLPGPPIIIGDNCWIGADVIVLPGVKIGDHVVIGAGSVVTKSFSDNLLIAGNPAKIIKELPPYTGNGDW